MYSPRRLRRPGADQTPSGSTPYLSMKANRAVSICCWWLGRVAQVGSTRKVTVVFLLVGEVGVAGDEGVEGELVGRRWLGGRGAAGEEGPGLFLLNEAQGQVEEAFSS